MTDDVSIMESMVIPDSWFVTCEECGSAWAIGQEDAEDYAVNHANDMQEAE